MTLEQLRIFVAVAERQHVTRAAEALNMAQSAVSGAVAALEGRHGAKLFHRVGRGIELTEAGQVFLKEARAVLARVEAAERALEELGSLKRGNLRLMASQTIASYWLPRHLVGFHRVFPGISLHLTIGNTAEVAAAVIDGTAELGFIEGQIESNLLEISPLARDQLIVVVSPEHPWAGRTSLGIDEMLAGDWVLRESGSGTRSVFEDALEQSIGRPPGLNVALELPSNEAVRAAVEAGLGATAISASVAAPGLEAGLLSAVPFQLPERDFSAVWHNERHRAKAADALLGVITDKRPRK